MDRLAPHEIVVMFLALGTLLGSARILGEIARRFHQPAVLGEILAGILLGPTVFGWLAPGAHEALFPATGSIALVLDAFTVLAITLFLLVAGMEVDLSTIWRQGKAAISVGISGMVFPFAVGFGTAVLLPGLMGREDGADSLVFALFFATALSISALPVIAKTLMDLNLYRTDLGMVVVAAAIFNDLIGWIIFAMVLGLMGASAEGHGMSIGHTIWMILALAGLLLTVGRLAIHRVLPWIQAHTGWPGGVLSFALTAALLCAALTEWMGVHAIFGAFLFGVALGDSSNLREQTRATIERFISFFFAPLFFASIGLKVDFIAHFDLLLVLAVLVIACFGKIIGCTVGARWAGMPRREAWAVGFGMNARGAMEIILGLLALQAGVIRERMFVALVVMALVTSMISGPMMQRLLREKKARSLSSYTSRNAFASALEAGDRWQAIDELARLAASAHSLDGDAVAAAVTARERAMATGLGGGVAVPHGRLAGLEEPLVAVGLSKEGVDFDAPDGEPARLILLLLTPEEDAGEQLELLAEIARTFSDRRAVDRAVACQSYTELLALLRSAPS
jgi:Kef-type K+ transport system membrane component KefB